PGPTVLIPYGGPEEVIRAAACLCAAYSKVKDGISARVFSSTPDGPKRMTAIAGLRKKFLSYVI
ncbi:MAG: hypothetical protein JRF24_10505, partial [Deltaproteobacteria bacterium]|nr:hypothetical protein [Deltaproteobacteria bacterium]